MIYKGPTKKFVLENSAFSGTNQKIVLFPEMTLVSPGGIGSLALGLTFAERTMRGRWAIASHCNTTSGLLNGLPCD